MLLFPHDVTTKKSLNDPIVIINLTFTMISKLVDFLYSLPWPSLLFRNSSVFLNSHSEVKIVLCNENG